jgi:hypothetical protein
MPSKSGWRRYTSIGPARAAKFPTRSLVRPAAGTLPVSARTVGSSTFAESMTTVV